MLKIFQARLQQYLNQKSPDVQAGFRKGRGTRDQIANIPWIIEKAREFQKSIYFCFIDYHKAFDYVGHNKLWKTLKEMGIPDHLTCLLRNLYADQKTTIRTFYGTMDWFKIEKGMWQGFILSPCLFNFYTEHISCEMPGWMCYKLESRLPGEISTTSDIQMHALGMHAFQSCLILCDSTTWDPLGSSVHGILQARILEWVAISSSRDLPDPGTETVSLTSPALVGWCFTTSTTCEAPDIQMTPP